MTSFPLVRARCEFSAQNLSADADSAGFPWLRYDASIKEGTQFNWADETRLANIAALDRNFSAEIRAQWIPLSRDTFGPVSIGVLLEFPWVAGPDASSTSSRAALGCTLQAAWYQGKVKTSSQAAYFAWYIENGQQVGSSSSFSNEILLSDANDPLVLDLSWLNLLAPSAPDTRNLNASRPSTTLEAIINATGISNKFSELAGSPDLPSNATQASMFNPANLNDRALLEMILAVLLTDGLSRLNSVVNYVAPSPNPGSWYLNQLYKSSSYMTSIVTSDGKAFDPPADRSRVHELRASITLTGYAYRASSTTDFLSIAVVAVYALLACAHMVCALVNPVTSSAWDTATELVALCQNSPPAPVLRNTSAGIASRATYKRVVRLRALRASEEQADERVALLFVDDEDVGDREHRGRESGRGFRGGADPTLETSSTVRERALRGNRPQEEELGVRHEESSSIPMSPLSASGTSDDRGPSLAPAASHTWPLYGRRSEEMAARLLGRVPRGAGRVEGEMIVVGKKYN